MADGTPIIIKKKKVSHGGGHHGGSWKVAYADFVTAMMAFFMVMWIMGLSDQTKAQIQGYFKDPFGLIKSEPASKVLFTFPGVASSHHGEDQPTGKQAITNDRSNVKNIERVIRHNLQVDQKLKSILKNVTVKITPEGLLIELVEASNAAFFKSGSAQLNSAAYAVIDEVGPVLKKAHRPIIIEGHTDAVPYPSASYTNWNLSCDRANALLEALRKTGVPNQDFIGVRGLADTDLEVPSNPYDRRNRRVSILLPFLTPSSPDQLLPKRQAIGSFLDPLHTNRNVDLMPHIKPGATTLNEK